MTRLVALVLLAVVAAAGISVVHPSGRAGGPTSVSADDTASTSSSSTNGSNPSCPNCV